MSETKHTPGPWEVGLVTRGDGEEVVNEAFVTAGDYNDDDGEYCEFNIRGSNAKANARLIAAAPDMRQHIEVQAAIIDRLIQRLVEADLVDDMDRTEFNQWSQDYQKIVSLWGGMRDE